MRVDVRCVCDGALLRYAFDFRAGADPFDFERFNSEFDEGIEAMPCYLEWIGNDLGGIVKADGMVEMGIASASIPQVFFLHY